MDIDFTELDYSKMMANPMVVPAKKSPEDVYEIFKRYEEFLVPTPDLDRKKLFRYLPLVYDKNSPLHDVISDIKKLKGKAADLAGFKKNDDGRFLSSVEALLDCTNRDTNKMIIRYVLAHKNAKYSEYCILREAHFKTSVNVLEDPDSKVLQTFKTLTKEIDEARQDILSKDNNKNLEQDFEEYYFNDKLMLRPEDVAIRRMQIQEERDAKKG